jgi:siroheme synthase (precorrin-2 oxidase/ferrochelatase)
LRVRRPFFPVGLNLDGRACVVIGAADDREAIAKADMLRESGADVRWLTDPDSVSEADVAQDAELSKRLRALADRHRFLLCCIDQPAFGSVAMMALAKAGPVRIAISTAGLAPRVGKIIKEALQRAMDEKFARFVERLAERREATRTLHPSQADSNLRRAAAIDAATGFEATVTFKYPEEGRRGER